jgi:hypothetical protein
VRPYLDPEVTLVQGSLVYFQPSRLKHNSTPPEFSVHYEAEALNPVHALATYLRVCRAYGQPIENLLARIVSPDCRSFKEKRLTSSQLTTRLRPYFDAVGVTYCITTHGCRRGAIQAMTQAGVDSSTVGELAQMKTPAVRICYQNERRHLPCRIRRLEKKL